MNVDRPRTLDGLRQMLKSAGEADTEVLRDALVLVQELEERDALNETLHRREQDALSGWAQAEQQVEKLQERLRALDMPTHILVLSQDRWTVEHTLACRESGQMASCAIHERIADWIDTEGEPALPKGRYVVNDGSLPAALEAVSPGEPPEPLHNPWDARCSRHLPGEPTREDARCEVCRAASPGEPPEPLDLPEGKFIEGDDGALFVRDVDDPRVSPGEPE